jgi:peptidoglycan/xylan/chitin deacetylase (PgdA/CDA1 family)
MLWYLNPFKFPLTTLLLILAFCRTASAHPTPAASVQSLAPTKVALTIDDLPTGSGEFSPYMTREEAARRIIATLEANGLRDVYGFSNGHFMEWDPKQIQILKMWLAAKYPLGNHTYHHLDLAKVGVKTFLDDIARQDQLLATWETSPRVRRVFRYPFLSEGSTVEEREAVRKYLAQNGYRIAEVTTDYSDWRWNDAFARCFSQHDQESIQWLKDHVIDNADRQVRKINTASERLLRYRIPQIVLIHLDVFTAITLPKILKRWKKEGVQFVSLDEALGQPIYGFDSKFGSAQGSTFLQQIAGALGGGLGSFDDELYPAARLDAMCKAPPPSPH